MGINQVGFIAPRSEPQKAEKPKKTAMEQIIEGLQIANGISSLGSDIQNIRTSQAKLDATARQERGLYTPTEAVDLQKTHNIADVETPGSQRIFISTPDGGEKEAYTSLKPPKPEKPEEPKVGRYTDKQGNEREGIRGPDGLIVQNPTKDPIVTPYRPKEEKPKDEAFLALPKPAQETVTSLTQDNAKKTSIVNQIDAELAKMQAAWKDGNEDLAVTQGQNMLKILNSTQGQDAVGSEEAKRLAAFLEYKLANFTGPGSFIGRDVEQFFTQAADKSNAIKTAIAENKKIIDSIYSSKGQIPSLAETNAKLGPKGGKPGEAIASPAGKPKQVIQNGHTYKLNEKTGEYE